MIVLERVNSLLIVGAHAFDAEVLAGPLAASAVAAGGSASLVHLSLGEQGHPSLPPDEYGEQKRREAAAAAGRLGCRWMTLELPDGFLSVTDDVALQLCDVIRRVRPQVVVTHWSGSWHKDHRAAHRLTVDAVYYAALPTLRRQDAAHTPQQLLFGENWEDAEGFVPDCVADVSAGMHAWRGAIEEYALATGIGRFPYLDYYLSLYRLRGCVSGFQHAQVFAVQPAAAMLGIGQFLGERNESP